MSSQGSLWHSRAHKLQSQLFPTLTVSVIGMASIRPSIFYTHLSWAGRASAHIWRRALGYSTSVTGLTRIAFTNYVQFKVSNSPEPHVLGLWEETGAPGRNPHRTQFRSQVPSPSPSPHGHSPTISWITFICCWSDSRGNITADACGN